MPDSKITLSARERCSKKTLAEQLEALRAEVARMEREADQADTVFAFECDRTIFNQESVTEIPETKQNQQLTSVLTGPENQQLTPS